MTKRRSRKRRRRRIKRWVNMSNLIVSSQGRDYWRFLVNASINLRVPQTGVSKSLVDFKNATDARV